MANLFIGKFETDDLKNTLGYTSHGFGLDTSTFFYVCDYEFNH